MTKSTSPFDRFLDLAVDAVDIVTDLAGGLLDEKPGAKPDRPDLAKIIVDGLRAQGAVTVLDTIFGKPAASADPGSTWAAATDSPHATPDQDPTADRTTSSTHTSTRATAGHSPGVHIGPDATGSMKVTALPTTCANLECPNQSEHGHFVLVEIEEKVVSNGTRGIRLWMCSPCASGMTRAS